MTDAHGEKRQLPWRTGRKVGRTIYAQQGERPSDHDPLIGVMDTPDLAAVAVLAHNHLLLRPIEPWDHPAPECPLCGEPQHPDTCKHADCPYEEMGR